MTEKSIPWPGIVGGAGAGVDSGRYTAAEWWAIWGTVREASALIVPSAGTPLRTVADWTNRGVFYGVGNRLEVTDAGGFVAEVDTGASIVEGQFHYNDATVSLTMPASQTYYVVVRKNYTAAAYTPPGWAAGDGVVPAYTSRITWVAALVQSTDRTTYWDIPLATVVTDGSEITSVTDTREWVEYIIRRQGANASQWVPPGTTNYTPLDYIEQVGSATITWAGGAVTTGTVTFPQPFAGTPLVFLDVYAEFGVFGARTLVANPTSIGGSYQNFGYRVEVTDGTGVTPGDFGYLFWRAIGPR